MRASKSSSLPKHRQCCSSQPGPATPGKRGVVLKNDTLSTVVARINRYARHGVVIADTQTSQLRISGVFHTGDIDGFVSTIVAYLPVRATNPATGRLTWHIADARGMAVSRSSKAVRTEDF